MGTRFGGGELPSPLESVVGAFCNARALSKGEHASPQVKFKPFPHVIVEKFVPKGRLAKISQDFPKGLREHVLEQKVCRAYTILWLGLRGYFLHRVSYASPRLP